MRIGIDTFSIDRPGGNYGVGRGVYAWNLLPLLFRLGRDHRFVVFTNRGNQSLIPHAENVTIVTSRLPSRLRPLRVIREQLFLPFQFKKHRLDLIHFLGNDICVWLGQRTLMTVYDLMWKYYLDAGHRNLKYLYFSFSVPLSLRRAGAILAISHFIARQTEQVFPFTAEKVFPIPLAGPPAIGPRSDATAALKRRYPFSFVFTVTTSLPHKNLSVLLQAFLMLKRRGGFPGKLLVCGQLKGDFHRETMRFVERNGLHEDVILTGFLPEEEKQFLFQRATVFVFPSLYEGFGLPILEAMQAGVPVVAARAASIPEVGGEACRYFDPSSAEDLMTAISEVLTDQALARGLVEKGLLRLREFSWEETARQTLAVYERLSHRLFTKRSSEHG